MTYDPARMSLLGPAGGGMLWSYDTSDATVVVQASTYFVPIWRVLKPGDRIHVRAGIVFFDMAVIAVTSSAVTTASTLSYA